MKRQSRHHAAWILTLCLLAPFAAWESHAGKTAKTITGKVKRAEVYRGKVRAVYIQDSEKIEYLVMKGTEKSKELLDQVGAVLKVKGYVKKPLSESDFAFIIDVLEYEVISPPAEPPPAKEASPPTAEP